MGGWIEESGLENGLILKCKFQNRKPLLLGFNSQVILKHGLKVL